MEGVAIESTSLGGFNSICFEERFKGLLLGKPESEV
jgi:hypothetical protein